MTDFEIASLAFQEMSAWAAIATAVVAVVVGPTQCLLIWKGLRLMERSNGERAVALEQQREADERRHAEVMAAHAEAMAAHDETMAAHAKAMAAHAKAMEESARRHAEAMEEGARRHAEAMAALAVQSRALETLIERTAPAAVR